MAVQNKKIMELATAKNFWHYNPKLQEKANALRKSATKAEACLWKYVLRAGTMKGYDFNRQRPVLNYIADFMCKELLLIIEVDGLTHTYEETVVKDQRKQADLEAVGFKVLRFTDEEVLTAINRVFEAIEDEVVEREKELGVKA